MHVLLLLYFHEVYLSVIFMVFHSLGYELHWRKCSFHCYSLLCLYWWCQIKIMTNTEIWLREFFSLFTFLNFFIQIFSHFLEILASHLSCPSYFTSRLYKRILECSLCYWGKNIIVCPFWKLLPSSSLHTWKKALEESQTKASRHVRVTSSATV